MPQTTQTVEFTAAEKLTAIRREVGMRRRVYPRWTQNGKMTPEQADREIAVMEAIAADYEAKAAGDAGPLFGQRPAVEVHDHTGSNVQVRHSERDGRAVTSITVGAPRDGIMPGDI